MQFENELNTGQMQWAFYPGGAYWGGKLSQCSWGFPGRESGGKDLGYRKSMLHDHQIPTSGPVITPGFAHPASGIHLLLLLKTFQGLFKTSFRGKVGKKNLFSEINNSRKPGIDGRTNGNISHWL